MANIRLKNNPPLTKILDKTQIIPKIIHVLLLIMLLADLAQITEKTVPQFGQNIKN